jgi:hypothetical protein
VNPPPLILTTIAMSEYTSTREGFQRAMEWSLSGDPNEAKAYAEALSTPNFYQVMNGKRLAFDTYVEEIAQWRAKVSEYKPVVCVPFPIIHHFSLCSLIAGVNFSATVIFYQLA